MIAISLTLLVHSIFPVEFVIFHSVITQPFVVLKKWTFSFKLTVLISGCYFCTSLAFNKLLHQITFETNTHAFTNIFRVFVVFAVLMLEKLKNMVFRVVKKCNQVKYLQAFRRNLLSILNT
jgi:hypothetical protein